MVIRDETYLVCDSESWRRWLSFTWSKFSVIVTRGEVVAIHSKKTDSLTKTFSFVSFRTAADAICTELQDEKKATYKYLSISGSEYSWNHCGEEKKKALLGNTATNDEAESTLGGTTANIQRFGRIALSSAGAVSDMKRNAFLQRDTIPTKKNPTVNQSGLFHQFPHELRQAIVRVAMKDAPVTKLRNNEDLALQAKARRAKEEMIKAKNMEKATEEYIEGMYYRKMYDSAACLKGSVRVVDRELKKLTSDTARYDALKENIMIRVKGLGWDWCKHAWSKNGQQYSIKELADHLRWIIKEERKRHIVIPSEPPVNVPKRMDLPVLGTEIDDIADLDKKFLANEEQFRLNADRIRRAREARGEGSMYSLLQPFSRPNVNELLGRRIDMLYSCTLPGDGGNVLRWCQGEVIEVCTGRQKPTVRVLWDPMPDVEGSEESSETNAILLPSKWRKETEGGWRMDVDITVQDELDEDNDAEDKIMSENKDERGSESDSETSTPDNI